MKKIFSVKYDFSNKRIHTIILLFGLIWFMIPGLALAESGPKVFGVTHLSVYKEYVKPRWYDPYATARLVVNSGIPVAFTNGSKISDTARYSLIVSSLSGQTVIDFEIDSGISRSTIQTNSSQMGSALEVNYTSDTYVATPVFAIWAEDMQGNFIQSLYLSALPATNIMRFTDGVVLRPQALPFWMHKACAEKAYGSDWLYIAQPDIPIPEDLDGVSGATQKAAFTINTSVRTNKINDSKIKIFFEVNQSFDSGWYFYGSGDTREEDGTGTFASDKFFSGSEEPSVVYCVDIDLNETRTWLLGGTDGTAVALPVGYSHYGGRTGTLYKDFYADDNGVQRYKFDHAHKMAGLITVSTFAEDTPLYTGDIDKDHDVDGFDIANFANRPNLIALYLEKVASNFGVQ